MAIGAGRYLIGLRELFPMGILVALLALGGRLFEVGVDEFGFEIRRLVAINTGHRPVRALQREASLVMIEALQVPPSLGRVTGLTPHRLAVGSHLHHAFLELALVRILVAATAR